MVLVACLSCRPAAPVLHSSSATPVVYACGVPAFTDATFTLPQREMLQRRRRLAPGNLSKLGAQLAAHDARLRQVRCGVGADASSAAAYVRCRGGGMRSSLCRFDAHGCRACPSSTAHIPTLPVSACPLLNNCITTPPPRSTCADLAGSCAALPCCTGTDPPLQCVDGGSGQVCSRAAVSGVRL